MVVDLIGEDGLFDGWEWWCGVLQGSGSGVIILGVMGNMMLSGDCNEEPGRRGCFGSWTRMTRSLLGVNDGYMRGNARF